MHTRRVGPSVGTLFWMTLITHLWFCHLEIMQSSPSHAEEVFMLYYHMFHWCILSLYIEWDVKKEKGKKCIFCHLVTSQAWLQGHLSCYFPEAASLCSNSKSFLLCSKLVWYSWCPSTLCEVSLTVGHLWIKWRVIALCFCPFPLQFVMPFTVLHKMNIPVSQNLLFFYEEHQNKPHLKWCCAWSTDCANTFFSVRQTLFSKI